MDHKIFNNRGIAYYKLGQYEMAIQDYDDAILIDPQNAGTYYNRGFTYYDLGQYERAIQDYDEVIRLNPQDAWAYNTGVLCTATLVSTSEPYRTTARPPDSSHRWRLFGSF